MGIYSNLKHSIDHAVRGVASRVSTSKSNNPLVNILIQASNTEHYIPITKDNRLNKLIGDMKSYTPGYADPPEYANLNLMIVYDDDDGHDDYGNSYLVNFINLFNELTKFVSTNMNDMDVKDIVGSQRLQFVLFMNAYVLLCQTYNEFVPKFEAQIWKDVNNAAAYYNQPSSAGLPNPRNKPTPQNARVNFPLLPVLEFNSSQQQLINSAQKLTNVSQDQYLQLLPVITQNFAKELAIFVKNSSKLNDKLPEPIIRWITLYQKKKYDRNYGGNLSGSSGSSGSGSGSSGSIGMSVGFGGKRKRAKLTKRNKNKRKSNKRKTRTRRRR